VTQPQLLLTGDTIHDLIQTTKTKCLKHNSLSAAFYWYTLAQEQRILLPLKTHNAMINIAGKVGRYKEAEMIFNRITHSFNLTPDVVSWTSLLESIGREHASTTSTTNQVEEDKYTQINQLIHAMRAQELQQKLKFTPATFSVMIDALSHNKSVYALNTACDIFLSIPRTEDHTTTNAMNETPRIHRIPTANHWSSIIEGCCRHTDAERAFEYIRWMKTGLGAPWKDKAVRNRIVKSLEPSVAERNDQRRLKKNPYVLCLTLLGKHDCDKTMNDGRTCIKEDVLKLYQEMEGWVTHGEETKEMKDKRQHWNDIVATAAGKI
jgi:pentatricopeptide repeat protein